VLKLPVVHPALLAALARAGHGSTILIADGNYPHVTGARPEAERIYLNFAAGQLTVLQVLTGICQIVPIERARVMAPGTELDTPLFAEYHRLLGRELDLIERFAFYDAARANDTAVVIATADQQHYANVLLTVGALPDAATQIGVGNAK
jgi:L-fucose mutarotase